MKKSKNLILSVLLAVCALCLCFALVGCKGGEKNAVAKYGYGEEGIYYFDSTDTTRYMLSLQSGTYMLSLGDDMSSSGTYSYDEGAGEMVFTSGEESFSADVEGDVMSLRFSGGGYTFLKYVFYDVTYKDADGATIATASVLNGKTAEYFDAEKSDYYFIGWYGDAAFNAAYTFDAAITGDTVIYAWFVEKNPVATDFWITYDFGGYVTEPVRTQNGTIYGLPEADGLLGWWISDTDNGAELTREYQAGEIFAEDATLFAVYDGENVIGASVTEEGVTWKNAPGSSMSVSVYDGNGSVVVTPWSGSSSAGACYTSSELSALPSGVYTVVLTCGGATETLVYASGRLSRVSGFSVVSNSILTFSPVEGATGYEITVSNGVKTQIVDLGSNTFYNFSEWEMTKEGLSFVVTACADGRVSSVSSAYVFSLALDTPTVTVEEDTVTWERVENAFVYEIYIDGELFDTTFDTFYSLKYFGVANLSISVRAKTDGYYSEKSPERQYNKNSVAAPIVSSMKNYTLYWTPGEGASGYVVAVDGVEVATVGSGTITSYGFSSDDFEAGKKRYTISVKAVSDTAEDSAYGDEIIVTGTEMGAAATYDDRTVRWQYVLSASYYGVSVNGGETEFVGAVNEARVTLTREGENTIEIFAYGENAEEMGTASCGVTAYAVHLDTRGGVADAYTLYFAAGDVMELPAAELSGYEFGAWYTLPDLDNLEPNGTLEYSGRGSVFEEGTIFDGSGTKIYYAFYTPYSYNLTLKATEGGYFFDENGEKVSETTVSVYFYRNYTLPVVYATNATDIFYGWYLEENRQGTQLSGADGVTSGVWNYATDLTIYSGYATILSFTRVASTVNGATVYAAGKGKDIDVVTEVTVPDEYNGVKVAVLQSSAFSGCTKLKVINIPDTMEFVSTTNNGYSSGSGAFSGCNALTAVNVYLTGEGPDPTKEVKYYSEDGVLFEKIETASYDAAALIYYPYAKSDSKYEIPETVSNAYECRLVSATATEPVVCSVTTIASQVFYQTQNVAEIIVPGTVTTIESQAFGNVTKNLTRVEIKAGVESADAVAAASLTIGSSAFAKSTKLTEVTLSSILAKDSFDYLIFNGCTKLENVYVNSSGDSATDNYRSSSGMLVSCSDGSVVYYPYAHGTAFTIADTNVTKIGAYAAYGNENIKTITVPGWVTSVGEYAFYGNTSLTEITFAENGQTDLSIYGYAFYGCTKLSSVELPTNLVYLAAYSFGKCSKLTTVTLDSRPSDTLAFEEYAFADTSAKYYVTSLILGPNAGMVNISEVFGYGITDLTLDSGNQNYALEDGLLYSKDLKNLVFCPAGFVGNAGEVEIAEGCETISGNVFRSSLISKVVIPASVASIGNYAFYDARQLKNVEFSNRSNGTYTLTVGERAFYGCTQLSSISLPEGTTTMGARTFYDCSQLTEVSLSSTLQEIPERAFYGCTALQKITIAEGSVMTVIGDYAFYNCSALTTLELPASVEEMGRAEGVYYVFYKCSSLNLTISDENPYFAVENGILYGLENEDKTILYIALDSQSGEVTIADTVTEVKEKAFYNNSAITSIVFNGNGSTVTIGDSAFANCSALASIVLPNGLTQMGSSLFDGDTALTNITIPNTVTSMANKMFSGCTNLKEVIFAEGGEEELVFATGTSSSGNSVFGGTKLAKISLPERVRTIPDYLFYNMTTLAEVTFPSTLTSIGKDSFYKTIVTEIDLEGCTNLETIGLAAFSSCDKLTTVKLPEGLKTITAGTSATTASSGGAFYGCKALDSITLPSTLETLGAYTFYNCEKLKTATFNTKDTDGTNTLTSKLDTLGKDAFYGCNVLESFELPAGVSYIDESAFDSCTALKTFTIPSDSKLTCVGVKAFNGCTSLESIEFPACIEIIGATSTATSISSSGNAFASCSALTSVTFETYGDGGNEGKSSLRILSTNSFKSTGLTSFTFPETIETFTTGTTLGVTLFDGCTTLTAVHISSTVTNIENVFKNCNSITTLTVAESSTNFAVDSANSVLTNKDGTIVRWAYNVSSSSPTLDLSGTNVLEIGENAFNSNTVITKVIFPATLVTIDEGAFTGCTGITEMEFKAGGNGTDADLTIADASGNSTGVFKGCTALASVTFPARVVKIGAYAFYGDTKLVTAEFETGTKLTSLGAESFRGCSALKSFGVPSGITELEEGVFRGCSVLESVTLPSTLTKFNKDSSGNGQHFYECKKLTSIDLTYVTSIEGTYSFRSCEALTSVKIPKELVTIGDGMFYKCTALTNITFENGLTTIGVAMFNGCTALTSVTIPYTVTHIGAAAFYNCTKLTSVTFEAVPADSTEDYTLEIDNGTGTGDTSSGVFASTAISTFVIPERLSALPNYMFYKGSLTVLTYEGDEGYDPDADYSSTGYFAVPEGTAIGTYAFHSCNLICADLTNVASLGMFAFYGNTKLVDVNFGDTAIDYTATHLFDGCSALTGVTLPGDTTALGQYMFQNTGLTEIVIPEGVTEIPTYAFAGCSDLESVTFEGTVTSIKGYAFKDTSSLTEIDLDDVTELIGHAFENSGLTHVELPSLTTFGTSTSDNTQFKGCSDLETVVLSRDLTIIPIAMFYDCTSLKSISYTGYEGEDNVLPPALTTLNGYAFYNCGLESIVIPAGIGKISGSTYGMFQGCTALTDVKIEEGLEEIGYYTFKNCTALESITIPYTVKTIGYAAFYGCTSLEEIVFEEVPASESMSSYPLEISGYSSSSADYGVFYGCSSLKELTLPERLTTIGTYAFGNCTSLEEVYIPASVTSMSTYILSSTYYGYNFYGCTSLKSVAYAAGGSLTYIGNHTFEGCTALESVAFPTMLQEIQESAFNGCESLKEVSLPSSLVTIVSKAFRYSGLEEVTIPASVTTIGNEAFSCCTSLQNIYSLGTTFTAEDGVLYNAAGALCCYPAGREGVVELADGTTLASYAFEGCDKITQVVLNSDMESLPSYAFYNCTALESIVIGTEFSSVTNNAFNGCSALKAKYYLGTQEEWDEITVGSTNNSTFTNATLYLYSADEPELDTTGTAYDGNFWHYDGDGEIVVWVYVPGDVQESDEP